MEQGVVGGEPGPALCVEELREGAHVGDCTWEEGKAGGHGGKERPTHPPFIPTFTMRCMS